MPKELLGNGCASQTSKTLATKVGPMVLPSLHTEKGSRGRGETIDKMNRQASVYFFQNLIFPQAIWRAPASQQFADKFADWDWGARTRKTSGSK